MHSESADDAPTGIDELREVANKRKIDVAAVVALLGEHPDLIDAPIDGRPLLHRFVSSRSNKGIAALLELGADANVVDEYGYTALARSRSTASAKLLIAGGADLNRVDHAGRTALFRVDPGVLRLLLNAGADVDHQDHAGQTLAFLSRRDTIDTLVSAGASFDVRDNRGATPFHTNRWTLLSNRLLREFDPSITDDSGDTPLHYAVRGAETWWIEKLRSLGAEELANNAGKKPMDLAPGRITVDGQAPEGTGHVGRAEVGASLFEGALTWEINIFGFGLVLPTTPEDREEQGWEPTVVDFRLYHESIASLRGKPFEHWHDLFREPITLDQESGNNAHSALYVYGHGSVEGSVIECTGFTADGCQLVWSGSKSDFGQFRCETALTFTGIDVIGKDSDGQDLRNSPEAVADALDPHVGNLDSHFEIVPRPHPLNGYWAVPTPDLDS